MKYFQYSFKYTFCSVATQRSTSSLSLNHMCWSALVSHLVIEILPFWTILAHSIKISNNSIHWNITAIALFHILSFLDDEFWNNDQLRWIKINEFSRDEPVQLRLKWPLGTAILHFCREVTCLLIIIIAPQALAELWIIAQKIEGLLLWTMAQ